MKRIISYALVVMLTLSLISCTGAQSPSAQPEQPDPVQSSEPAALEDIATYKEIIPEQVLETQMWGQVPINQVIVVFRDEVDKLTARQRIEQIGGVIVGELDFINLYQVETADQKEAELIASLEVFSTVEGVELVFPNVPAYLSVVGTSCSPLSDPVFSDPANAHYNLIGMENAWKIIKASGMQLNKVDVGVLDTEIYSGSSEFSGKVKLTGDSTDIPTTKNNEIVNGGLSHGTRVAHVIGADAQNSGMVGVAGVLEENLSIHVKNNFDANPLLVPTEVNEEDLTQVLFPEEGVAYTDKTLVNLKKMVDDGATVINCSFNFKPPRDDYEPIVKAYEKFFRKMQEKKPHVVFIASAGNSGNADKSQGALNGKNDCPAGLKLPNVVTVGAINNDGSRAEFSSFATENAEVTLSAPGVAMVVGTDDNGQPIKSNGTSFSAPQVAAAIALIQSISPEISAGDIKEILVQTAAPGVTTGDQSIPIPEGMGAGVLRVDQAVLQAINKQREKQDLPPFALQQLLDIGTLSLTAEGSGAVQTLAAHVPGALQSGVQVKIEVNGQHSLTGDTTQTVAAGGDASWEITLDQDEVFVRVTRLDNGACAYMTLTPQAGPIQLQDMSGTFSGTAVLQNVVDGVEAEESLPVTIQFGTDGNGSANVYGFTGDAEYAGGAVSFKVRMEFEGHGIYAMFEGKVSRSGSQIVISGPIRMYLMGVRFATYQYTAGK